MSSRNTAPQHTSDISIPRYLTRRSMHRILESEEFYGRLCLALPEVVNTNLFVVTEQWARLGYGTWDTALCLEMRRCEKRIRGALSFLESRQLLDLPTLRERDYALSTLLDAATRYCELAPLVVDGHSTPFHRSFSAGLASAYSEPIINGQVYSDEGFDNIVLRRIHLSFLSLRGDPDGIQFPAGFESGVAISRRDFLDTPMAIKVGS
jgi:hypothetical protein